MPVNRAPLPADDKVVQLPDALTQFIAKIQGGKADPYLGLLTDPYMQFFTSVESSLDATAERINSVELETQGASVGTTDMSGGSIVSGLYLISYVAQITRAATVSSSLTVTFTYTRGGITQTFQKAAITGNTTTTHDEATFLLRADSNSPINYATTYASVGGTTMQYALDVILSRQRT